jgi:hypothetical protein
MRRSIAIAVTLFVLGFSLAGCDSEKSSNPTSPSIAGPIEGVTISTPKLLEPATSQSIDSTSQPITLLFENSASNGVRTVTYIIEIATDVNFTTKVFTRDGVAAGTSGRTSIKLPDALSSDRTYYWRVKATDGANSSDYSSAAAFTIVTPASIAAPTPVSPVGGAEVDSTQPTFVVNNSTTGGKVGTITYVFQISTTSSFTSYSQVAVTQQTTQTQFTMPSALSYETTYYWRVRGDDGAITSAWAATQTFVTPEAPVVVITPTPTPGGAWPTTGDEVVAFANANYADYLVAGVSSSQRQSNMIYIRDRMIEAGTCGGMTLAWNLKRGGPTISIDFLTYKKSGTWIGVDIAYDYDNTSSELHLQWAEAGTDNVYPSTYTNSYSCK